VSIFERVDVTYVWAARRPGWLFLTGFALLRRFDFLPDIATVGSKVGNVDVNIGPGFLNIVSEHLYSSPNKAFEELVSNSWNAGVETVYISIPDERLPDAHAYVLN
jgi:hypothetical protein